jgi:hypothetical protein
MTQALYAHMNKKKKSHSQSDGEASKAHRSGTKFKTQ